MVVANQYDYRGRRIRKTTPTTETTFVYDGWNLILETTSAISGATTNVTEIQYFWGADLSESLQGAGGVGGLLAVSVNGSFYFPAYDNNGNVTKYIDESGDFVAAYEYDAFGRLISQSGPLCGFFRIRFSPKYHDAETGLYYYGYRFYSPSLMRWLNRDPIAEDGGLNLYGFCGNNAVSFYDALGLCRLLYHKFGTPPPSADAAGGAARRGEDIRELGVRAKMDSRDGEQVQRGACERACGGGAGLRGLWRSRYIILSYA